MSDFHKEMLERMYREIPAADKATFIIDILKDLPQSQRLQILEHLRTAQEKPAPTTPGPLTHGSPVSPAAKPKGSLASGTPIQQHKPVPHDIQQLLDQAKLDTGLAGKQRSAGKKTSASQAFPLQDSKSKGQLYKELFMFLLFCGAVLAVIVGMAVGAKHLWDLLRVWLGF